MTVLREGWLWKVSSKEVLRAPRRLYAALSTRALFLYREDADRDPVAYLKLDEVCCR